MIEHGWKMYGMRMIVFKGHFNKQGDALYSMWVSSCNFRCYINGEGALGMISMIGLGIPLSGRSVIIIRTHWTSLRTIGAVLHIAPYYEMLERVKMMERLLQDQGAWLLRSLILRGTNMDCWLSPMEEHEKWRSGRADSVLSDNSFSFVLLSLTTIITNCCHVRFINKEFQCSADVD